MNDAQPTSPPTVAVRDDPGGTLSARLRELRDCAEELLIPVPSIATEAEFLQWREQRREWRRRSAYAISAAFEREAVEEFIHASAANEDGKDWSAALTVARRGVAQGGELLDSLCNTLSAGAGSSKRGHGPRW